MLSKRTCLWDVSQLDKATDKIEGLFFGCLIIFGIIVYIPNGIIVYCYYEEEV